MTFIYSFLQKRKMHENQHGIIMVVIAYALSVLLLVLGSDVFYNISSAAAGISADTEEETEEINFQDTSDLQDVDNSSLTIKSELMNPYGIVDIPEIEFGASRKDDTSFKADTVWFLGSAVDDNSFDTMMNHMSSFVSQADTKQANIAASGDRSVQEEEAVQTLASDTDENNTIETFSVKIASSDTVITIAAEEVTMLERIVEAEAEGEDMVGKILIANVIFNRIADEEFPDTVEEVIFQKSHGDYQFSPVDSGRYWSVDISEETVEAVQRALDGDDYSEGALYFIARKHTKSESAKWFDTNLNWLFKHGGHEFYK